MTFRTILAFQFGNRGAIEKAAKGSATLWTGLILTLTVSIARNYDQTWILDSPLWLFGNVLFSLVSSWLIFILVYKLFLKKRIPPTSLVPSIGKQYRSFLGLFWMTAPIAWLYAIPVERWFDSYSAAQYNLVLLGIVSLWRVLLLARVFSVITQTQYHQALSWTLFVASTEVIIVMILGFFSNIDKQIMAGMSGMRNSPEENMMIDALGFVFMSSLAVWVLNVIVLSASKNQNNSKPFPLVTHSRIPWIPLVFVTICWAAVAIEPQRRLVNNSNFDSLLRAEKYDKAMEYLKSHKQNDFSSYKFLAPDPYAWEVWQYLGPVLDRIEADDPLWLKNHYSKHMEAALSHGVLHSYSSNGRESLYISLIKATSRFPEGKEFVKQNRDELTRIQIISKRYSDSESEHAAELQTLLDDLLGPLPEEN